MFYIKTIKQIQKKLILNEINWKNQIIINKTTIKKLENMKNDNSKRTKTNRH